MAYHPHGISYQVSSLILHLLLMAAAWAPPSPRDDASWEKRFESIKFNSDDAGAPDAFHNFKRRYELSLRASHSSLLLTPKPPAAAAGAAADVTAAANYERSKWDHYDLLFLNCLANSVTGTQQATVVLTTNSGHEAWVSLCNKNESKHSISAVSL